MRWYCPGTLVNFQEGLSFLALFESMEVSVDEMLEYAAGRLGSVICFTLATPSHHILYSGVRAKTSDSLVHGV